MGYGPDKSAWMHACTYTKVPLWWLCLAHPKPAQQKNILRKGVNADYQYFLLLLQCFLVSTTYRAVQIRNVLFGWKKPSFNPEVNIRRSNLLWIALNCWSLCWSRGRYYTWIDIYKDTCINLFQNKPWFLPFCSTSLLKTLWEKWEIAHNMQFLLFHRCFLFG